MKRVLILLHIIFMHMHSNSSQKLHCKFTGWKIKVTVTAGKQLSWSINYNGERILNPV